jgi:hypothetical protein
MAQTLLTREENNVINILLGLNTREQVRELRMSNLYMSMSAIARLKTNIAALYAAKSAQINFAAMNVKRNGTKSQLSVHDAESFFSGMFTGSWLTTAIIAILYFAAEIAKADGLEHIMDSNRIPNIRVRG